mgnify:CR=1 FL=1
MLKKAKIHLVMDVIFENDTDIGRIPEIAALPTVTLCRKGEKYRLKKEKIYDASRCRFDFEGKSDGFSGFIVEKFAPIEKNLRSLAEFTEENGGRIELTAYFEKRPKPSDLSVHGKAKALLYPLNPDIYFSF